MNPIAKPPMIILPPLTACPPRRAQRHRRRAQHPRFGGRGGLQDFCARRAFRILQVTVLLHDERAAQRDHHENA